MATSAELIAMASLRNTSKFLSYVLRHEPGAIGLELDPEGWANIDELILKANVPITRELLFEVVETSDKKRFAISEDGASIRAQQGHSVDVDLGLAPIEPPERLYHGTATRFLADIAAHGLRLQSRQYVHLSPDAKTAAEVGRRHGKPVVLTIAARRLHLDGHRFFKAGNGVWLTKFVPPSATST